MRKVKKCLFCYDYQNQIKELNEKIKKLEYHNKLYPHRMDFSKVKILREVNILNKEYDWIKIQQDAALIKEEEKLFTIQTDAVHANRLVWFGLLERKEKREGLVRVTQKGIDFLKGNVKIPSRILTAKGVVFSEEGPHVSIDQIKNVVLDKDYWDNYPKNE